MPPAMILGLGLLAFVHQVIHDAGPVSFRLPSVALGGAVLSLFSLIVARTGRRVRRTVERAILCGLATAPPLALFGAGIALWANDGSVTWTEALMLVAAIALIAGSITAEDRVGLLAAQCGLWAGVSAIISPLVCATTILFGGAIAAIGTMRQRDRNLAARLIAEEQFRNQTRAQEFLADFEETGQGWFWETDRRGRVTYLSPPVADMLGRSVEDFVGQRFTDLFNLAEGAGEGERTLTFHLSARSGFSDLVVRAASHDEERWWSISGRPTYDPFNNFQGFRGWGADLTERKRSQEHASRLAHFDSLTGLSNRFRMSQSLEKILIAPQEQQRACAVFLLDLDRFKQVNDTLGHPAGDLLLKHVAQRLERCVGVGGRVGRLGGDEFQVIIPGMVERVFLADLAARIIDSLSQPYMLDTSRVMIGASIGIALAPEDGVTSEALIRNADLALYAAKDGGRGRYHFYAPDLHSDAEERRQLEEDLRDAITLGQLSLHYQPVVHTATEKIAGFEALLRWYHPVHGFIPPVRFVPIAEDTGLIATIGEWALRQACADLATWPAEMRVAVNVSPLQFANPTLPATVTSALAHAGVDPDRLELEITESVFLNDDEGTEAMFRALKGIGVRLALDDFGTGYSSLGYLKRAPFDKIKIDQSFVRGATEVNSRNGAIIASIVSLAEALGMETTAEGVETLDELDLMRMLGCSHVQGFIYERPLTAEAAAERMSTGLIAIARGPRAARAMRQSVLRKVVLEHGGHRYDGTIRNLSQSGALIEGVRNVPPGTIFRIELTDGHSLTAACRWSGEDRMGVEFSIPLRLDDNGRVALAAPRPARAPIGMPEGPTVDQVESGPIMRAGVRRDDSSAARC